MDPDIFEDISGSIKGSTTSTSEYIMYSLNATDVSGVYADVTAPIADVPGACIYVFNTQFPEKRNIQPEVWPVAEECVKQSMQSVIDTLLEPPVKIHETLPPILAVETSNPVKKSRCTIV